MAGFHQRAHRREPIRRLLPACCAPGRHGRRKRCSSDDTPLLSMREGALLAERRRFSPAVKVAGTRLPDDAPKRSTRDSRASRPADATGVGATMGSKCSGGTKAGTHQRTWWCVAGDRRPALRAPPSPATPVPASAEAEPPAGGASGGGATPRRKAADAPSRNSGGGSSPARRPSDPGRTRRARHLPQGHDAARRRIVVRSAARTSRCRSTRVAVPANTLGSCSRRASSAWRRHRLAWRQFAYGLTVRAVTMPAA